MIVKEIYGASDNMMSFFCKNEADLYQEKYNGFGVNMGEELINHPPELILRSASDNKKKHKGKIKLVPDIGHFTPGA